MDVRGRTDVAAFSVLYRGNPRKFAGFGSGKRIIKKQKRRYQSIISAAKATEPSSLYRQKGSLLTLAFEPALSSGETEEHGKKKEKRFCGLRIRDGNGYG